ncbi:MAG: aminotransferase class I/II-fold pyridoxal phosphate-dependent enzyme [Thermomicrobiales bacterium]
MTHNGAFAWREDDLVPDDDCLSERTRATHAGEDRSSPVRPLVAPIAQSSVLAVSQPDPRLAGMADGEHPDSYSRDHLANVSDLERAIASLEGAESGYAVSSGMAAISLVFLAHLRAGDHVVLAEGAYCDTEAVLRQVLGRFGVAWSTVRIGDRAALATAMQPRTRIVFVETIANPSMEVADLDAIAEIAHRGGALLVVDNTFATPLLCKPLAHGADLVVHSVTKFLGGHHDLTAGAIVGGAEAMRPVRESGYLIGALPGAMDAWLALRGIHTLAPRMSWICESAQQVATAIAGHPAVASVAWPGLATGGQRDIAARMLTGGYGGMMLLRLAGGEPAVLPVLRALRLVVSAGSLGGTTTTICRPPRRTGHDAAGGKADGCLRLSIGLESAADIIADVTSALDAAILPDRQARPLEESRT